MSNATYTDDLKQCIAVATSENARLKQRITELEAENKRLKASIQSIHELLFVSHNEPNENFANNEQRARGINTDT